MKLKHQSQIQELMKENFENEAKAKLLEKEKKGFEKLNDKIFKLELELKNKTEEAALLQQKLSDLESKCQVQQDRLKEMQPQVNDSVDKAFITSFLVKFIQNYNDDKLKKQLLEVLSNFLQLGESEREGIGL